MRKCALMTGDAEDAHSFLGGHAQGIDQQAPPAIPIQAWPATNCHWRQPR